MNHSNSSFIPLPSISYTYTMTIGFTCLGTCFVCSLCGIIIRTIYEREQRERQMTNLQRLMFNLPEIDLRKLDMNELKQKHRFEKIPLGYGQMMTMLGRSIKEMDEFKQQLQSLPMIVAEKLGNLTTNETKKDAIENLQRVLVENQFHFAPSGDH